MTALTAAQRALAEQAAAQVPSLARRAAAQYRTVPESDFVSEGNEAAVRAAVSFVPGRCAFDLYAFHRIWNDLRSLARKTRKDAIRLGGFAQPEVEPTAQEQAEALSRALSTDRKGDQRNVVKSLRGEAAGVVASMFLDTEPGVSPEEEVAWAQARKLFDAAMQRTGDHERRYFQLAYQEERTQLEIAAALSMSERTVRRLDEKLRRDLDRALRLGDPA